MVFWTTRYDQVKDADPIRIQCGFPLVFLQYSYFCCCCHVDAFSFICEPVQNLDTAKAHKNACFWPMRCLSNLRKTCLTVKIFVFPLHSLSKRETVYPIETIVCLYRVKYWLFQDFFSKGGSKNYGNMCWADGIFPPRKKSLPLHFFTRKKSLPRHFFRQKKCLPRHFSGQKKSLPLHLNWVKSTLQIIQKGYYDYAQWWVVVNWTISKHMTHSASSVRQESINNKKAVNVISAKKSLCPVIFFVKKSVGPVIFFFKKSLCPFILSLKKSACSFVHLAFQARFHGNNINHQWGGKPVKRAV